MNNKTVISNIGDSWAMDFKKLTETDRQILQQANFPVTVKAGFCIQRSLSKKRVDGTNGGGIYVPKEVLKLSDVTYRVVSREVAKIEGQEPTSTNPEQQKLNAEHKRKVEASESTSRIYLSTDFIDAELDWFIENFCPPRPTEGMKVEPEKPKAKAEKPKADKAELTDEQKTFVTANFADGTLTAKEIAKQLNVDAAIVTAFLKSDAAAVAAFVKNAKDGEKA